LLPKQVLLHPQPSIPPLLLLRPLLGPTQLLWRPQQLVLWILRLLLLVLPLLPLLTLPQPRQQYILLPFQLTLQPSLLRLRLAPQLCQVLFLWIPLLWQGSKSVN
jgi:hypothetical protein